jgi:SMC interacting uncharacterized protein involved in chromosome segregation
MEDLAKQLRADPIRREVEKIGKTIHNRLRGKPAFRKWAGLRAIIDKLFNNYVIFQGLIELLRRELVKRDEEVQALNLKIKDLELVIAKGNPGVNTVVNNVVERKPEVRRW